jgi:hypothetical protein
MGNLLDSKPQIWRLAADLGLPSSPTPSRRIRDMAVKRIRQIAKQFECANLNALLKAAAADVDTVFEEIHSDDDLDRIQCQYVQKGEKAFANLQDELRGETDFAITIRRVKRDLWDRQFVSVIDCRGSKKYRSYFTKWHELAHLLTLTPQMRLVFRRTHSDAANQDPEEKMMDVIAAAVGFLPDFLDSSMADISFDGIGRIREVSCPDASLQAATIGIVKALPVPCILVEAKLALRKHESLIGHQLGLGIAEAVPVPVLRAVNVTVNDAAKDLGIRLHKNWRVPAKSVIARIFLEGGSAKANEDLSNWTASGGSRLEACPVIVEARKSWESAQALIVPQIQHVDR